MLRFNAFRFWHAGLLIIMVVGLVLLITGYDAGLPLYESKDERRNLNEVYALRGLHDQPLWKPGYPPGILGVNYSAQVMAELVTGESAWDCACTVIRLVRIEGIAANLITALLIALVARKLGGDAAGLIAPLAWFAAPGVLKQAQFGFPQVYEGLFYMLTLYMAVLTLEKRQPRYAVYSVLAGLGAVVFKYPTFPALGLSTGAVVWNLRHEPRRWARVLALQLTLIILTAIVLFTLGNAGALADAGHVEANNFKEQGWSGLLNLDRKWSIFTSATRLIGLEPEILLLFLGMGTLAYWFYAKNWQRLGWVGAVALALSHVVMLSTYLVGRSDFDRNVLSTSSVFTVIVAVSIVAIGRQIGTWLKYSVVGYVFTALVALLWLLPQLTEAWDWVQYRKLPVTYAAWVQWLDQHLPGEALLVKDERPFTRDWSCSPALERRVSGASLMDYSVDKWLEKGFHYIQLLQSEIISLDSFPKGQAYLDRMALLKTFPEPTQENEWRTWRRGLEPQFALYQLLPPEPDVKLGTVFGDMIRLVGYNMNSTTFSPGDTIEITPYWQPIRQPDGDYHVYIHLAPQDTPTAMLVQRDGPPSQSRPTDTWSVTGESFFEQTFSIDVPHFLAPGQYQLNLGLYDWKTGQRLFTSEGQDHIEISIQITSYPHSASKIRSFDNF